MGKRIEDIRRKFDAFAERIITELEELRKKKKNREVGCEGEQHLVKDFMDMLLDFVRDENSDVKLTKDHIKALTVVSFFLSSSSLPRPLPFFQVLSKSKLSCHSLSLSFVKVLRA